MKLGGKFWMILLLLFALAATVIVLYQSLSGFRSRW
jgi:hypothetical protein